MAKRVITRDEVIGAFAPLHGLLDRVIAHTRAQTTLERFAKLHPEIEREAGIKRLSGQARWMLVADGLVASIGSIDGFAVHSSEAQHNSGQYLFEVPGGLLTVRQEPHDDSDPDDGKYVQQALTEILEQAELAPGMDADKPLVVYLSVTATTAMLKVCHDTLDGIMKIAIDDLRAHPQALPTPGPDRPRARARSTRSDLRPGVADDAEPRA